MALWVSGEIERGEMTEKRVLFLAGLVIGGLIGVNLCFLATRLAMIFL